MRVNSKALLAFLLVLLGNPSSGFMSNDLLCEQYESNFFLPPQQQASQSSNPLSFAFNLFNWLFLPLGFPGSGGPFAPQSAGGCGGGYSTPYSTPYSYPTPSYLTPIGYLYPTPYISPGPIGCLWCGDGLCDWSCNETWYNCPSDCQWTCGDNYCDVGAGESPLNCGEDCASPQVCGSGGVFSSCPFGTSCCAVEYSHVYEYTYSCVDTWDDPQHCGGCNRWCSLDQVCQGGQCVTLELPQCGNLSCESQYGENCNTCPSDCLTCPINCPNGVCEGYLGEGPVTCPTDCACGNGNCGDLMGLGVREDCLTCPVDCGTCPVNTCGDGVCELGAETQQNCLQDCGWCGDGACQNFAGESYASCGADCICPSPLTNCGDPCWDYQLCYGSTCTPPAGITNCAGPPPPPAPPPNPDPCYDLQNDPLNCGSCGNQCAIGQICSGGQCVWIDVTCGNLSCGNGENCDNCPSDCGACPVCTDYSANACGGGCVDCVQAIGIGAICNGGVCSCPPETTSCRDSLTGVRSCTAPRADPQNCGGCSASGSVPQGENCLNKQEVCYLGNCGVTACTSNSNCSALGTAYKCCGTAGTSVKACTNVNSQASVVNCGACGNTCGSGGNAGRPFCCPSGGTYACSSAPCPGPI